MLMSSAHPPLSSMEEQRRFANNHKNIYFYINASFIHSFVQLTEDKNMLILDSTSALWAGPEQYEIILLSKSKRLDN